MIVLARRAGPLAARHDRCTVRCPVGCLGLSPRADNPLRFAWARTVGDVLDLVARGELEWVPNLGPVSVAEIMSALLAAGFGPDYQILAVDVGVAGGSVVCGHKGCGCAGAFTVERMPPGEISTLCPLHACTALLVLNDEGYRIRCCDEALAMLPT